VSKLVTAAALSVLSAGAATAQTLVPAALDPLVQAPVVSAADESALPPAPPGEEQAAQAAQPKVAPPQASQPPADSRQAEIEQRQAEKAKTLHPYESNKAERIFERLDAVLAGGSLKWHPFFQSAYAGGGFTLGLGYAQYVSAYNLLDVRGSYTIAGYKRVEAEFIAPRMFNRRGHLSVLGGWREATQVGFYGIGTNTSKDDRTNYLFNQPYGSAVLTVHPTRRFLMLRGGVEYSQWSQESGQGSHPSVEERYTADELPGLGARVKYLHTLGAIGLDGRTSPGYSRRGAYLAASLHDYRDRDERYGFQMAEYEGIAHLPILREAWVLSLHGRVQTAFNKDGQQVPFFMLPALGGGSSLRGYASWRFRDMNSILLQAEWRVIANRYLDLGFFYDAGKVTGRTSDLDFDGLKDDFGVGVRFHGPAATPLRIELAKSREGLALVFASSASF
jgi:hypothetical protein